MLCPFLKVVYQQHRLYWWQEFPRFGHPLFVWIGTEIFGRGHGKWIDRTEVLFRSELVQGIRRVEGFEHLPTVLEHQGMERRHEMSFGHSRCIFPGVGEDDTVSAWVLIQKVRHVIYSTLLSRQGLSSSFAL